MLKKFMGAVVLVLVGSIALAETIRGTITAITDTKVTVVTGKKGDKKTTEYTLATDKDKKVTTTYNKLVNKGKDKEKIEHSDLKKAIADSKGGKGVAGSVEVTGEGDKAVVTEINIGGKKKKKAE